MSGMDGSYVASYGGDLSSVFDNNNHIRGKYSPSLRVHGVLPLLLAQDEQANTEFQAANPTAAVGIWKLE
jgi:hypothetical protein